VSQYEELDRLILSAIKARRSPLYEKHVWAESKRIAEAMGRSGYRVIDGRLQALRKAGSILHVTKAQNNGSGGWQVAPKDPQP
jgi:hypothetical protein